MLQGYREGEERGECMISIVIVTCVHTHKKSDQQGLHSFVCRENQVTFVAGSCGCVFFPLVLEVVFLNASLKDKCFPASPPSPSAHSYPICAFRHAQAQLPVLRLLSNRKALVLFIFVVPSALARFLAPRCPQIFVNAWLPVLCGRWRNLSLGLLAYHFLLARCCNISWRF